MRGTPQTIDDGAYDHLSPGTVVPEVHLLATTGQPVDVVADSALTVIFLYPATGTPGGSMPEGWLEVPGAFGCTAESCGYRDLAGAFEDAGAAIRGVSTQTPAEQKEFAEREGIGYPLLSDESHRLVEALRLPLFTVASEPPRIKRATLIVGRDRALRELMYPVPDPAAHASAALALVRRLVDHA